MSEAWINQIVEDIKVKDHNAAEQAAKEKHRLAVIAEKGPIFWRSFADFLKKFVEEIRAGLEGDVTQGNINCEFDPTSGRIQINKSAFPFLTFNAAPNYSGQPMIPNYVKVNPQQGGSPHSGQSIPCRFEVVGHDDLILQLNGSSYAAPDFAAKFLIEKLFTI